MNGVRGESKPKVNQQQF